MEFLLVQLSLQLSPHHLGLAFPWALRITCPNSQLTTVSFPALKLSTCSGFSSKTCLTKSAIKSFIRNLLKSLRFDDLRSAFPGLEHLSQYGLARRLIDLARCHQPHQLSQRIRPDFQVCYRYGFLVHKRKQIPGHPVGERLRLATVDGRPWTAVSK